MDKVVWKDKLGNHVMVGDDSRVEQKRKDILESKNRQDNRRDQNDTAIVVMLITCVLSYAIYMMC